MQELDQFKTKMLTWAKKLAQDLTALNKKIKAARPVVSEAPMGIVPGAYEGQIMVHKSGPMIKCYCWANRDWNEIGEISQSVLNNLEFEISNSILTKAGQSQKRKPMASMDNMGKLFVNYGTCTVEVVDSTGNWKLLNGPLQNSGIPNYTPETGLKRFICGMVHRGLNLAAVALSVIMLHVKSLIMLLRKFKKKLVKLEVNNGRSND